MDEAMTMGVPLEAVTHVIQVALTPVFLLTGIGSLLGVITQRLGRVLDQAAEVRARGGAGADGLLGRMRVRVAVLDAARALGALAGMCTCGSTFALFLAAWLHAMVGDVLVLLFGGAVLLTLAALAAFLAEVLLSLGHERALGP